MSLQTRMGSLVLVAVVIISATSADHGEAHCDPVTFAGKMVGYITDCIGPATFPWKVLGTAQGDIFLLLIGFGALLSPIAGIMLVVYFVLHKTELNQQALFSEHGKYGDSNGWNMRAIVALVIGVLPNLPGFLKTAGFIADTATVLEVAYTYAWFVGLAIAVQLHYLLMPRKAA